MRYRHEAQTGNAWSGYSTLTECDAKVLVDGAISLIAKEPLSIDPKFSSGVMGGGRREGGGAGST